MVRRIAIVFGSAFLALWLLTSCAQKTQILTREDGTYTSVALGPTEKEALKIAAAKATEMCKSQQSRFALIDRRTSHHGAKTKKADGANARKPASGPEEYRVELVFACK